MKRLTIVTWLLIWLSLPSPTLAQGPGGLIDAVQDALSPVVDFLDDYAALAGCSGGECGGLQDDVDAIWGGQLLSTDETGQGVPDDEAPPAEYYADSPEEIRQMGYTLETLTSRDISAMSALDFANWLGYTLALPFLFVRGLQDLADLLGPFGVFLSWLLLAALWVGMVYFISFLVSFVSTLLNIGGRILQAVALFKP